MQERNKGQKKLGVQLYLEHFTGFNALKARNKGID